MLIKIQNISIKTNTCLSFIISFSIQKQNNQQPVLFIYPFNYLTYGLFNKTVSGSEYVARNGMMTTGQSIGKDMDGSSHGLIYDTIPAFARKECGEP